MAGFFGFFNYAKEGPGIEKDAPKKKAFVLFFETFFRNFWKFIAINLTYVLFSATIITHGLACSGMTDITRNIARDKHSFGLSDFFGSIRKNWKQSLIVGIINTILTVLIIYGTIFYNDFYTQTESALAFIGLVLCFACITIFSIMKFYIYTLLITFKYSIKTLYTNSFKFVFINFWKNTICGICILLTYGIYIALAILFDDMRVIILEVMIASATLPAFKYLLIQFFTFDSIKKYIIDPYYLEHPNDDIEMRRNLGLDTPEEENFDTDNETI